MSPLLRLVLAMVLALAATTTGLLAFDRIDSDAAPVTSSVGPVDRIVVRKAAHKMQVYSDGKLLREFQVALGRGGLSPKERQGDNRVPEGNYAIAGRNPTSAFHLSLRIGYPRPDQVAAAEARGVNPGGDIMIHGLPNGQGWLGPTHRRVDWTRGCIAVTNEEMDWLWRAVRDGTPIEILA